MVSSEAEHTSQNSNNWDCLDPCKTMPLVSRYCVPTGRCQAKLAATWSAMAPTGEEEGDIFGEFEVSNEDLQPASTSFQNEARQDSISSKFSRATSNSPSALSNPAAAGLQTESEPPNVTSANSCAETSGHASDPPLSPSIDGSHDSPTLASSFTFAGWESQGPAQNGLPTAAEAAEQDDAESWLSAKIKQSSNDTSTRTEPQHAESQVDMSTTPSTAAGLQSKDSIQLSASFERQQYPQSAQLQSGSIQPISSPTLQLDLTQQDTGQLALECAAQDHRCLSSRIQGAGLPAEGTRHSESGPELPTSSSGQHASTASQPVCSDGPANSSQCLPRRSTHQQQSPSHEASSLGGDQLQPRALSGFLTPLGKLAGMFGWAPGKPNTPHRPLHRLQGSQAAAAAADHMHPRQEQLAELARPANSAAVPQEQSASMLQVDGRHLTLQQLQNLQKAAEILLPRSMPGMHGMQHSPSHVTVSSSMRHLSAQGSLPADHNLYQQPDGEMPNCMTAISERQLPSPPSAKPDGGPRCGLDSSSNTANDAIMVGGDGNAASLTQADDDMLAAALASRLAMMAPCLSSLYSKRSTFNGFDANNPSDGKGGAHTLKRKHHEQAPTQQQGELQVSGFDVADPTKIAALAIGRNQVVQHVSQHCLDHAANARKRFRKTTGLEVLRRSMPSLWQNQKQKPGLHQ